MTHRFDPGHGIRQRCKTVACKCCREILSYGCEAMNETPKTSQIIFLMAFAFIVFGFAVGMLDNTETIQELSFFVGVALAVIGLLTVLREEFS